MKARLYKIVIAAEFDDEQEIDIVADAVVRSLQSPDVPAGHARVQAVPLDPMTLEPMEWCPTPRHLLN